MRRPKRRLAIAIVTTALASAPVAASARDVPRQSWKCTTQSSVGFYYNQENKAWEGAFFQAGRTYTIAAVKDERAETGYLYRVGQIEEGYETYYACENVDFEFVLFCDARPGQFVFNRSNMRFTLSYMMGYWNVETSYNDFKDENSARPALDVGTCIEITQEK